MQDIWYATPVKGLFNPQSHLASLCLKGLTGQTVNSELWHTQSPNTVFKVSQETEYQTIFTVYSSKGRQIMYKLDKHNRANRHPTQAHTAKQEKQHFPRDFKQARDGRSVSGDYERQRWPSSSNGPLHKDDRQDDPHITGIDPTMQDWSHPLMHHLNTHLESRRA